MEWELTGETDMLKETDPNAILSTTNPTWLNLGSNLSCHSGKLATNCLTCGMAALSQCSVVSVNINKMEHITIYLNSV
jgi:hypothetical protein